MGLLHHGLPAAVLACLLLALGGCGEDSGDVPEATDPTSTPAQSELKITVISGPGAEPTSWTLTCDPPGGTHPDPAAACAAIEAAPHPFAPVPADMMCTQIYGGPETATITGTWHGEPVSASYKRNDGCEIARWNALAAVLASGS